MVGTNRSQGKSHVGETQEYKFFHKRGRIKLDVTLRRNSEIQNALVYYSAIKL